MAVGEVRTYEVTFCSRVSKWADNLFSQNPAWNLTRTEIEESKHIRRKRSDLRVYGAGNRLVLAGEVKMPGTPEGRNAYSSDLINDAFQKASNAAAEFFFTWNVNKLVLFDSKKWDVPLMERRVKEFDLGLDLDKPDDVDRPEVEKRVQEFLGEFFTALNEIATGKILDWGMPGQRQLFFSWKILIVVTQDYNGHAPRHHLSSSSFPLGDGGGEGWPARTQMDTERYNAKEHRGTKGTKGTQINMHKLSPNL